MNDPHLPPFAFPPCPPQPRPIAMTEKEIEAGDNILQELATSDDSEEIFALAEAYQLLILSAGMRMGFIFPAEK